MEIGDKSLLGKLPVGGTGDDHHDSDDGDDDWIAS